MTAPPGTAPHLADPGGVLPSQHAHLASGGAGLRLPAWKNARLELAAADALSINAPGTRAGVWRFLFGLNTSL